MNTRESTHPSPCADVETTLAFAIVGDDDPQDAHAVDKRPEPRNDGVENWRGKPVPPDDAEVSVQGDRTDEDARRQIPDGNEPTLSPAHLGAHRHGILGEPGHVEQER